MCCFHISASSGTTAHLGGSNGADFSVIVALLSLGMTCIMLAKAYTTCVHKQRRVEQQLAIDLLYFGKQWHPPHHDGIVTMRVLLLLSLATIFLAEPCQPKPMQFACTRKGVLSSNWSLFHISASSGTTLTLVGADFCFGGRHVPTRGECARNT